MSLGRSECDRSAGAARGANPWVAAALPCRRAVTRAYTCLRRTRASGRSARVRRAAEMAKPSGLADARGCGMPPQQRGAWPWSLARLPRPFKRAFSGSELADVERVIQAPLETKSVRAGPRIGLRRAAPPPRVVGSAVAEVAPVVRWVRVNIPLTTAIAVAPKPRRLASTVVCIAAAAGSHIVVQRLLAVATGPAAMPRLVAAARRLAVLLPALLPPPHHSGMAG